MSSKKYKGKPCVYCGVQAATTRDHVFARQLFADSRTEYLPQVPACEACNNAKSNLEHYLATVLPFSGRHPDAAHILETDVPRRLAKNASLHRDLRNGAVQTVVQNSAGESESSMAIPFDGERLHKLVDLIVRGLMWEHWSVVLGEAYSVRVMSLTKHGEGVFLQLHRLSAKQRIGGDLGNGTFRYQGAQGIDYPELSTWAFEVYGGAHFAGAGPESGRSPQRFARSPGGKPSLKALHSPVCLATPRLKQSEEKGTPCVALPISC